MLTLNGGSSSIRFAVYEASLRPQRQLVGRIDRIGTAHATLIVGAAVGTEHAPRHISGTDHGAAAGALFDWLETQQAFAAVRAVGHRVVHGLKHAEPQRITPRLLAELHRNTQLAPDHLPRELKLIEAFGRRYPRVPQVACFDTAFHRSMPRVARLLPIPQRYATKGVERYGFHGLSYAYLMEALRRISSAEADGRVILAHLGGGASLAAVRGGKSIDTSMGFTPASGLMMGTRTGDLDPGLAYYLARSQHMTPPQFQKMTNHAAGLLGVSGRSADVRDLLARESHDARAADALALFCYQAKKWIGAYVAALGGVDTLVFAGGIGENAPVIRERICDGLGVLGIRLHKTRNAQNAPLISTDRSRATVRVIHTDEDVIIAKAVVRVLKLDVHRTLQS